MHHLDRGPVDKVGHQRLQVAARGVERHDGLARDDVGFQFHLAHVDVAEGFQEVVQAGGPERLADDLRELRVAALEHVAAIQVTRVEIVHRLAHGFEAAEAEGETAGERVGVDLVLVLLLGRQQQFRFQEGEPGGHQEIVGGEVDLLFLRLADPDEILVGQFEDRDLHQVDLVAPGEVQQHVQRALVTVEIDRERVARVGGFSGRCGEQILVGNGQNRHIRDLDETAGSGNVDSPVGGVLAAVSPAPRGSTGDSSGRCSP